MATDPTPSDPNRQVDAPRLDDVVPDAGDRSGGPLFHATWSGPLPPPSQLRQYEETHPGLAERIVVVFEQQVAQRFKLESHIVTSWRTTGGE